MSQQKVDKYKEEKKNRKKTMRIQKVKQAIGVLVVSLGIGALVGIPLGKYLYKYQKAQEAKHRTIAASDYDTWFEEKWAEDYGQIGVNEDLQKLLDEFNNASATDATASDSTAE